MCHLQAAGGYQAWQLPSSARGGLRWRCLKGPDRSPRQVCRRVAQEVQCDGGGVTIMPADGTAWQVRCACKARKACSGCGGPAGATQKPRGVGVYRCQQSPPPHKCRSLFGGPCVPIPFPRCRAVSGMFSLPGPAVLARRGPQPSIRHHQGVRRCSWDAQAAAQGKCPCVGTRVGESLTAPTVD